MVIDCDTMSHHAKFVPVCTCTCTCSFRVRVLLISRYILDWNTNYGSSSSESAVKSTMMRSEGPAETNPASSPSSAVRSIISGRFEAMTVSVVQTCALKTLRVVTSPQRHLAKSRRNSASESPGRVQESSRMSRSNTV